MADELPLNDVLPNVLQNAVDKNLLAGEKVLMTLAGASGEALVVTDQRVMIVREQMSMVGSSEVDCFSHHYEQIQTVMVEGAVGGGHLKLSLFSPPTDDHQVTLFFPSYDLQKFDVAASRIRLLAEQTRGLPIAPTSASDPQVSPPPSQPTVPICSSCMAQVAPRDLFCGRCGAAQGTACGLCFGRIPNGASFCPSCGTSASEARELTCPRCHEGTAPNRRFCTSCGQSLARICAHCGAMAALTWARCGTCGRSLEGQATLPTPWQDAGSESADSEAPSTAEQHNALGMKLYEQEKYQEAIREFEIALDMAPGTPLYHCNLGVAYAEMGRDDDAIEEYQTAVRLAPNDPTAYLNLGYFHSERENESEAERMWRRVLEVAPDSPEASEARQNLEHSDEI